MEHIFIKDAISLDFRAQNFRLIVPYKKHFLSSMSLCFALLTVENNKNKKSIKFQGDMLNFCDFIQVFVFTTNHHLNAINGACNNTSNCQPDCNEVGRKTLRSRPN